MTRNLALIGLAVALAAAPLTAAAQVVPFARDAVVAETKLDGKGGLFVLVMFRESSGKLAVCGAHWMEDPTGMVRSLRGKALQNMAILVDGKAAGINAGQFASYDSEDEAVRGGARCVASRLAWNASFSDAEVGFRGRQGYIRD